MKHKQKGSSGIELLVTSWFSCNCLFDLFSLEAGLGMRTLVVTMEILLIEPQNIVLLTDVL